MSVAVEPLKPVDPVRPVSGYIGGKKNLAKRLIAMINAVPHDLYAEAFVGMGGVFLRRTHRPRFEVINDWSEDVSTLFRVIQHHYVPFVEMIRHQVSSRANFEKLVATDPATLTDLQRSARFLYLQRLAFGGNVDKRSFGVSTTSGARFDVTKIVPMIEDLHGRLAGVVIERLPWADFMARYDREHTLFYLDPPYYGCENDYGRELFDRAQFPLIAEMMAKAKGKVILSLNDHPDVRRIFAGLTMHEVSTTYMISGAQNAKPAAELIITNLKD